MCFVSRQEQPLHRIPNFNIMSWIAITIDTLYEAKVAALIDACNTAALADGQPDRVPGIIQGVVDDVRRKVASCKSNLVDQDTTKIPNGLRNLAVDLIVARLKNALEMPLTEDERNQLTRHETNLNRIASCTDVVDQPDGPVQPDVQSGPAVKLIRPNGCPHPFRNIASS
jgi:hypothetical protein